MEETTHEASDIAQGAAALSRILGFDKTGAVFDAFGDLSGEKNILAVDVALRVIEANTGKVIWYKEISGKNYIVGHKNEDESVMIGSHKMTNEIYAEAMSNAAENIIDALIADVNSKKLFGGEVSE